MSPLSKNPDAATRAFRCELERRFRTATRTVQIGGRDIELLSPANADDLISEDDYVLDERLPYWADLWPSAQILAREVRTMRLGGQRVLELGCGLGIVAVAAVLAGGARIGYVFQFAALFDSFSIGENVAMGLRKQGELTEREIIHRVDEVLDLVDLPGVREHFPAELSGGMRKRVGIARAIALRPKYILYDEPTTGLDPVTSAVIDQLMVRMREKLRVTGVVITHDMRSAYTVGTRIAMLYQGRVRWVGAAEEIKRTTDPVVRQFIEGRPTVDGGVPAAATAAS